MMASSSALFPESGTPYRIWFAIALGFWGLVAAITLGNALLQTRVIEQVPNCPSWYVNGLANLPYFLFWAVLTPLLWRLMQRRLRRRSPRQLIFLAGLGFLVVVCAFVFKVISKELIIHRGLPDHDFGTHLLHLDGLHVEVLIFAGTCMALLAWDYQRRFRERQLHAAELEGNLAKARLQALRMQIQPHFLFNALNTISALVERNPKETRRVVARLSQMIRTSLDMGDDAWVPLAEEIAFLEHYLEIERVRYGPRLTVTWEVEEAARSALVPSFLIQPLVENAVRHGIARVAQGGLIQLVVARRGGDLEVRVRDNGPGCSLEGGQPKAGIGLGNVMERLERLFGDGAGVRFSCPAKGGFEAYLRMPFLVERPALQVAGV
jgi:signal transduction histidine kinase